MAPNQKKPEVKPEVKSEVKPEVETGSVKTDDQSESTPRKSPEKSTESKHINPFFKNPEKSEASEKPKEKTDPEMEAADDEEKGFSREKNSKK